MLVLVDSSGSRGCVGRRSALDAAFEDAFDVPTVRCALACYREGALTGGVHRGGTVFLGDANQAEYRPVAHLGLGVAGHRATRNLRDVRPELTGPVAHTLR